MSNDELAKIAMRAGRRCVAAARTMTATPKRTLAVSLGQLLTDLGEAITRTYSLQCFVSTNLMIFLSLDEAIGTRILRIGKDRADATRLIRSYIAATIAHGHRIRARPPDRKMP